MLILVKQLPSALVKLCLVEPENKIIEQEQGIVKLKN